MADWTIIIEKAWKTPGGEKWNNTYEATGTGATTPASLANLVNALVAAERMFHQDSVLFVRARVTKWAPTVPYYDPTRFVNTPIGLFGSRVLASDDENTDLELCWKLSRSAATGNGGLLNYRGVLGEKESTSKNTGRPELLNVGSLGPTGSAISNFRALLSGFLNPASAIGLALIGRAKVGGTRENPIYGPIIVRRVTGFGVFGVGRLPLTHKTRDRKGVDEGDLVGSTLPGTPYTGPERIEIDGTAENGFGGYDFTFGEEPGGP
jgi:hypothetical protein